MQLLERIEDQISATGLPLIGITIAAVPCPDTPVILTLHWHGFVTQRAGTSREGAVRHPVPSSALQLNDRWSELAAVDRAAMDAAWALGAWDVARAERPACTRGGAASSEALECMQAFGQFDAGDERVVVREAPDADDLVQLAAARGYLTWFFRPVSGGIWAEVADDATLGERGRRTPPCPLVPVPPRCEGSRRTVYRFGMASQGPRN
jgi:hypothetical protein